MGKQRHKRGTRSAATPSPSPVLPPTPFWRVVTLPTLAVVALVASVWFYQRTPEKPKTPDEQPPAKVVRPTWEPTTEDDRLVDAFRKARNEDAKATLNLDPDPVFDDKPVSEAEADAMQSAYLLHRARQIGDVRPGEPGKGTTWLKTPGRYTLTTRIEGSAPKVAVKVGDRVEAPSGLFIINPDIVVEIRKGKIHALRAEIHRD